MAEYFGIGELGNVNTVDFVSVSSQKMYRLVLESWNTEGGPTRRGVQTVRETFTILRKRTGDSTDYSRHTLLDGMMYRVWAYFEYGNYKRDRPVYLYWRTADEDFLSGNLGKRALIYDMSYKWLTNGPFNSFNDGGTILRLTVDRHPYWEDEEQLANNQAVSNMDTVGDLVSAPPLFVSGSASARVQQLVFSVPMGSGPLKRVWMGIKPNFLGLSGSSFDPVLKLGDTGTNGTDASDTTDSNTSGTNIVDVDFSSSEAMVKRATFDLADLALGTDVDQYIGRFLLLLRCKVDSGVTAGVRLYQGYRNWADADFTFSETVYATNTDWRFIELAEIDLPTHSLWDQDYGSITNFLLNEIRLQIYAERLAGSGSLFLDTLTLIPSHHFIKLDGVQVDLGADDQYRVIVHPDDTVTAMNMTDTTKSNGPIDFTARNFALPVDTGSGNLSLVVAAERDTVQTVSDLIDMDLTWQQRWIGLRGAG